MDHMDMDMGMFTTENMLRAKTFWYLIAAWVGLLTLLRLINAFEGRNRIPGLATLTAVYRELVYPQPIWFTGKISKYFTPPPVGRLILIACYWIVVLTLLWSNAILDSDNPYRWEKVGYRAAWISVSQVPLVYLLSCKLNPLSLLTGVSYERLNWLHRWTARTVFLTIIVHWSYFFYEWWLADFVELELEMMPMVKYGFGAWAVIGWMCLSGFGYFRAVSYELFVVQHVVAAAVLLWLLYMHVPAYAMYNVWLSIGFVAFDWACRFLLGVLRNLRIGMPGYLARLEPLPGDVTKLTMDVDFKWRAGQHVYLSVPAVRPLELHPFTIANNAVPGQPLVLLIKAHSGFSKSLLSRQGSYRVFINGPFGMPPDVSSYDTVVLVACSTGISFILPILQELVQRGTVRRIVVHWMIRDAEHKVWAADALATALTAASAKSLTFTTHVTTHGSVTGVDRAAASSMDESSTEKSPAIAMRVPSNDSASDNVDSIGRPQLDTILRPAVESALGETAIVACGGMAFTAQIRTYVAALSDERAVHKGTGAQGIFLFTETYGWG